MQHYGDNFIPVVPNNQPLLHTAANPFCWDETSPCHDDSDVIAGINDAVSEGIITADDVVRIIQGKTV